MLATALVVFREILEASLIVGIVLAACPGIAHRATMALAGVTAGVLGSVALAAAAGRIAEAAAGVGQEILNAAILGATVVMLGWHSVWMSHYGRRISIQMRAIGHEVAAGRTPVWVLGSVIALAVLREGSEIVLFLYGAAAGGTHRGQMLSGGILGLAAGMLAGMALYHGLLRVPLRLFFTITGALILFVAAGLASQAAGMLVQAGLIEHFSEPIWDTSQLISDGSIAGNVLHALLGYTARPAAIQVVCYVLTLCIIGGMIVVSS
ncbi:MAG TPA: FTR1 family protein, partial [Burkholderiales bacterium]|nr:FTR1 family protein [Burkholderiales bacterium]